MHLFLTIVAFIVIFSLLILIHELGHFTAAKRAGVKVEEFGFGLPPRMFGVKKGETLYSFNWIPFGGFVRMLGEDDNSKEGRESKRSYSNQPFRVQLWIVAAGVIMNLLLSFVLLTIGFVVGIEPLIATQDDFLQAIREGTVHVEPGIVVTAKPEHTNFDPTENPVESQLQTGDRILGFETLESWQRVQENPGTVTVDCSLRENCAGAEALELTSTDVSGVNFATSYLPRLVYRDSPESIFHGVLNSGEVLLSVGSSGNRGSSAIFTEEDLYKAIDGVREEVGGPLTFEVYDFRQGVRSVTVDLVEVYPLINYVEEGSPADQLGLQAGDEIEQVNGQPVHTAEQVILAIRCPGGSCENPGEAASFVIQKVGSEESTALTVPLREDGRVGVSLSNPVPYYGKLSLYSSYAVHTLMGTDRVQYGWRAPIVAVQEMWRLGKMTAGMFVNVLKQFVTAGGVPEGVSGPVGIAQMTGITLTQGWAAMLRFVALLSLSLGVINILPFPALDGGHFAVILMKAISGKKATYRWEHIINLGGFLFLMAFILYITFNDVMNLF